MAGYDVESVADWPADPGDAEVLAHASRTRSVLITLDKDFGELAIVRGHPHAGIIRLVGHRAREQGPVCVAALARYGAELADGALVTVEPTRVRIRPVEGGSGQTWQPVRLLRKGAAILRRRDGVEKPWPIAISNRMIASDERDGAQPPGAIASSWPKPSASRPTSSSA